VYFIVLHPIAPVSNASESRFSYVWSQEEPCHWPLFKIYIPFSWYSVERVPLVPRKILATSYGVSSVLPEVSLQLQRSRRTCHDPSQIILYFYYGFLFLSSNSQETKRSMVHTASKRWRGRRTVNRKLKSAHFVVPTMNRSEQPATPSAAPCDSGRAPGDHFDLFRFFSGILCNARCLQISSRETNGWDHSRSRKACSCRRCRGPRPGGV